MSAVNLSNMPYTDASQYQRRLEDLRAQIMNEQGPSLKSLSEAMRTVFTSPTEPIINKVLALRLLRDLMVMGRDNTTALVESLLPEVSRICQHEANSSSDTRGETYFQKHPDFVRGDENVKAQCQQLGLTYFTLAIESILMWSNWVLDQPDGKPSQFVSAYNKLQQKKVVFPNSFFYYKQSDTEKFNKVFKVQFFSDSNVSANNSYSSEDGAYSNDSFIEAQKYFKTQFFMHNRTITPVKINELTHKVLTSYWISKQPFATAKIAEAQQKFAQKLALNSTLLRQRLLNIDQFLTRMAENDMEASLRRKSNIQTSKVARKSQQIDPVKSEKQSFQIAELQRNNRKLTKENEKLQERINQLSKNNSQGQYASQASGQNNFNSKAQTSQYKDISIYSHPEYLALQKRIEQLSQELTKNEQTIARLTQQLKRSSGNIPLMKPFALSPQNSLIKTPESSLTPKFQRFLPAGQYSNSYDPVEESQHPQSKAGRAIDSSALLIENIDRQNALYANRQREMESKVAKNGEPRISIPAPAQITNSTPLYQPTSPRGRISGNQPSLPQNPQPISTPSFQDRPQMQRNSSYTSLVEQMENGNGGLRHSPPGFKEAGSPGTITNSIRSASDLTFINYVDLYTELRPFNGEIFRRLCKAGFKKKQILVKENGIQIGVHSNTLSAESVEFTLYISNTAPSQLDDVQLDSLKASNDKPTLSYDFRPQRLNSIDPFKQAKFQITVSNQDAPYLKDRAIVCLQMTRQSAPSICHVFLPLTITRFFTFQRPSGNRDQIPQPVLSFQYSTKMLSSPKEILLYFDQCNQLVAGKKYRIAARHIKEPLSVEIDFNFYDDNRVSVGLTFLQPNSQPSDKARYLVEELLGFIEVAFRK